MRTENKIYKRTTLFKPLRLSLFLSHTTADADFDARILFFQFFYDTQIAEYFGFGGYDLDLCLE